ncbi:hypothetical protein [Vibrio panuliri]|uniref:DUF306 domain-containing protein n=1 Tax=Vibrio panuliri TaxID=1381081 RepID=A0ABX3FBA0_9VIBR|nr:hypothetical protein [Vibrio panuliri]KAB1457615.1 hypothetical protein F7O85_07695 [Vibrio panuliri]OLQ88982.1 hypothetical protein BIY20_12020 [Vibrio panuliri]
MKRFTFTGLLVLSLSGCNDSQTTAIETYLATTDEMLNHGWTISRIVTPKKNSGTKGLSAVFQMGKQDQSTLNLRYTLVKRSGNYYPERDKMEASYAEWMSELCPDESTKAGKEFWAKYTSESLYLSFETEDLPAGFAQVTCKKG